MSISPRLSHLDHSPTIPQSPRISHCAPPGPLLSVFPVETHPNHQYHGSRRTRDSLRDVPLHRSNVHFDPTLLDFSTSECPPHSGPFPSARDPPFDPYLGTSGESDMSHHVLGYVDPSQQHLRLPTQVHGAVPTQAPGDKRHVLMPAQNVSLWDLSNAERFLPRHSPVREGLR